jgi:uncharacterized membrane protein
MERYIPGIILTLGIEVLVMVAFGLWIICTVKSQDDERNEDGE